MTMTNRNNTKHNNFIMYTIDELVSQDHLVRKLEDSIDFSFIYEKVNHLYSKVGRASVDPVILFKMLFINIVFGINSMRKTCDEAKHNLAYRWFLGLSIDESIPNYSTWSQNYIRRYNESNIFEEIFDEILLQARNYGFVSLDTVFGDGTHQKANANKRKSINEEVEIIKKKYEDDLLAEINEERIKNGKKQFKSLKKSEFIYDEITGEEIEVRAKKSIKVSTTDPESGCYHKGEKEQMFAYEHQTFCDKKGFVIETYVVPGNIHDSVSFVEAYQHMKDKYGDLIKNISLDAGYKTPAICKTIIDNNQTPYMPYKRPMTKKGYYKKYEFIYDKDNNQYTCPNQKILKYTTTSRDGYHQYLANKNDCINCPFKYKCTKSDRKQIQRHIWESYVEAAEKIRHTPKWKEIYPLRKQSIERVFGDCKQNHNLRFTRLKGLKQNQNNSWLIFACHNLKKMALWHSK